MTPLLLGLALGAGLIVLANLLLVRFTRMNAQQAAMAVTLTTLGLYAPYAIVRWPGGDIFAIHLAIYLLASLGCGMVLSARASGRGVHWGPVVIGGFFVFVVASGGVFIAVAERGLTVSLWDRLLPKADSQRAVTSVFPGVVSHDFHKKESLYNQYLQQVERQRQRGWQVQKGWLGQPVVDEPALFRVAVRTRDEKPVTGATVAGQFLRPSTRTLDVDFTLQETAPGVYESKVILPAAGRWNLALSIRKGEALHEIQANTSVLAHSSAQ
ncbi:MAG: FixH family protein [Candidatus Competibacteraceae bacterium]|nr:FixH family protein [Candidatus Competibacteraceae bacterium]